MSDEGEHAPARWWHYPLWLLLAAACAASSGAAIWLTLRVLQMY